MPISRTVQGIIVFDTFDSVSGWEKRWLNPTVATLSADYSVKQEGAASLRTKSNNCYFMAAGKYLNFGTGSGRRIRIYHKFDHPGSPYVECSAFAIATSYTKWYDHYWERYHVWKLGYHYREAVEDWTKHTDTLPDFFTGEWYVVVAYLTSAQGSEWVDRLVISRSDTLTVTGLTQGQKVGLYDSSDDSLISEQTCAAGEDHVHFDLSAEEFPLQLYMKVYATNGTTLLETTASYQMCGGDEWTWTAGFGTLSLETGSFIIHRQAATGTPKTATLTATLTTPAGAPYSGASIGFSTTLGTMNPASDTTDANGEATSDLTSTDYGIAVVKAQWLGDENVPACSNYCVVHVFYEAEDPDEDEDFQFFVEGIEYGFSAGRYAWNEEGKGEEFEVELPEWDSTITKNGLVSIYRKGIKEFAGILKQVRRKLSTAPTVVLSGGDNSYLGASRLVETKIYADDSADTILTDLLDSYPCGLSEGTFSAHPELLTLTVDTEMLRDALLRIAEAVGWALRFNLDRSVDFAADFTGGQTSAVFAEGVNIFDVENDEDLWPVANRIRMRGDGITSTKQDGTKIQEQGLQEGVAFQKKISDQATLDLACEAELDLRKATPQTVVLLAHDEYDPGTFACEDEVTITSATVDCSGFYRIKRIERDMSDAEFVLIEASNRLISYWALEEAYRRMVKDAST